VKTNTEFRHGNLKEKDHTANLDVDGRKIFTWIKNKRDGKAWTGLSWLGAVDKWRALILWLPQNPAFFLTSWMTI
jgi:hypothetical protein